jgi:hypothetical protein
MLQKMGVKGAESLTPSRAGMDNPLIERFKYFFARISLSDANDAPPQLD